ncbi:uncharacterized protein LOC113215177 isoform X3 [Frankliniella occidentalis]|uniref:Uncharacterized protein LOC113215177 isoform X3 n=1 Tax=Frankliniella occidentalis TaxID=133901 RepID=A0A9C6XSW6_FRAOC|nr:uncharacterized protein LOC113215177 isoform X3 [Frankliniella occidentalis]
MASLPWVPWATNRTEVLSPAEIERIVQMHKESKQNAVIYVLVVLAFYFVALSILVGRYLQNERDLDLVMCLGQVLERCMASGRRVAGPATLSSATPGPTAPGAAPLPAPAPRKFSLKLPSIQQPRRPPRPRHPMTDDESSETSSPPYSPALRGLAAASASSSDEGPPPYDDGGLLGPPGGGVALASWSTHTAPGRASPAVVSVMVCDLQDTPV